MKKNDKIRQNVLEKRGIRRMQNLSKLVRSERKARNLTQADLAEMADLAVRTISRIENNDYKNVDQDTLKKVQRALDLDIRDIDIQVPREVQVMMENEVYTLLRHTFKKDYQLANEELAKVVAKYDKYRESLYFKQLLFFAKGTAFEYKTTRVAGLNYIIKALSMTQPDLVSTKNGRFMALDLQKIEEGNFTLLEYGCIKEIGVCLAGLGRKRYSLAVYQSLLTSIQKKVTAQDIKEKLLAITCANIANRLIEEKQYDEASNYIHQGITFCHESGNIRALEPLKHLLSQLPPTD